MRERKRKRKEWMIYSSHLLSHCDIKISFCHHDINIYKKKISIWQYYSYKYIFLRLLASKERKEHETLHNVRTITV